MKLSRKRIWVKHTTLVLTKRYPILLLLQLHCIAGLHLTDFILRKVPIERAAAIAPWFHLQLPFCGLRFESQAQHLRFFNLYFWNCYWNKKRMKINKKRPGLAHIFKEVIIELVRWVRLNLKKLRREPLSSGQGRRLVIRRFWVQILALDTGCTFFTLICCKNCNVCLKGGK